jgi:hypothetical protein
MCCAPIKNPGYPRFLYGNRTAPFHKTPNISRGSYRGTTVPLQQPCKG